MAKRQVHIAGTVVRTATVLVLAAIVAIPASAHADVPLEAEVAIARSLPDPAAAHGRDTPPAPSGPVRGCPDLPRAEIDRPDIVDGPSVHVVYLLAADSFDQQLDIRGTLHCTMEAQNGWLEEQSGKRWNLDVFEHPVGKGKRRRMATFVDVTFVRSQRPAAELAGATAIRDELIAHGLAQVDKRYLTYVMGRYTTYCGDAIYPVTTDDDARDEGGYAQVYLSSTNSCNAQFFGTPGNASWSDAIAQQELLHTEGLAPIGAPHSCPMVLPFAHVCTAALFYTEESLELDPERFDLMYPYVSVPLSEKVLDRGNDDYFGHELPLRDLRDSPYLVEPEVEAGN